MTAKNFRAQSPSPEPSSQYVNIIEAIPPEDTQPLVQVLNQPVPTTQLGVYTATSVPPLPPTPQMSSSSSASSHANAVAYPDISQTSKILRRTPPPVPGRSLDAAKTSPAILLVGLTGSGKSTLISLLTKAAVTIGHDLSSCTSEIATYTANIEGTVVRLIDTPGFDDTNRSDTDILGAIALTLAMLYRERVPLLGVLYLHRISDTRVGGASRKCLRILENLAGQSAFGCFLIATTMWDKVSPAEGDRREKELVLNPQFFGTLYNKGSGAMIMRHSGTRESAKEIVKQAMTRWGGQSVVLQIQRQLVDEGLPLEATTAGRFVDAALREQQAKQQEEIKELEAALQECRDDSTLALLKEEHQAQLARVQELNTSRQGLRGTYRQLADRLIPRAESPSNIDWDSGYSKEGSIAASEIIALREELQMMKDQMRLWQDSQAEQEYTLLTMKAEQRMQKYNTEEERRNLLKAFEEKSAELAKRERMEKYRDRERRKLESQRYAHGSSSGSSSVSHHHGHGGRSTGTGDRFWRWISGPGYGSVSMFG